MELFWMAVRYMLWHQTFGYMGLGASLRLYAWYVCVGSTYIFINFAVSHTHKDVVPKSKHISWSLYSANHTTNCSNNFLVNWWMAYLNFQIEHHLFPRVPRHNLREVEKLVMAYAKKEGIHYHSVGFVQGNREVIAGLYETAMAARALPRDADSVAKLKESWTWEMFNARG